MPITSGQEVGYDSKQDSAYGWIPASLVPDPVLKKWYAIPDLKKDILATRGQDVHFDPIKVTVDNMIVLPYSVTKCNEKVFQEFDLREEFHRQFPQEYSRFSFEIVQGGIQITGHPTTGVSSSALARGEGVPVPEPSEAEEASGFSEGDAKPATLFFHLPPSCGHAQSGQTKFVLQDLSRGVLRIVCTTCDTEIGKKLIDPGADFERDLGVSRRYLTYSIERVGENIVVTLNRAIAYMVPKGRLQGTLIMNLSGRGITIKQASLKYYQQGGFWMDGILELLISQRDIQERIGLGEHTLIESREGQALCARFLDFRCP